MIKVWEGFTTTVLVRIPMHPVVAVLATVYMVVTEGLTMIVVFVLFTGDQV